MTQHIFFPTDCVPWANNWVLSSLLHVDSTCLHANHTTDSFPKLQLDNMTDVCISTVMEAQGTPEYGEGERGLSAVALLLV